MSGIDTSIYSQLLRPAKSVADYDAEAMALQQNRLALAMQQTQLDDRSRGIEDGNRLRQAVASFGADKTANYNALLGTGNLKAAQEYEKTNAELGKTTAETARIGVQSQKDQFETILKANGLVGSAAGAIMQNPDYNNAVSVVNGLKAKIGPELSQKLGLDTLEIPRDPAQLKAWANEHYLGSIDAGKQLDDARVKAEGLANRNNQVAMNNADNATSRANNASSNAVQMRGQNMTDARTREATRGQIIQTDAGPMLANPLTGTARPVMGPDGAALQAKLKPLPAPVQKAMMENDAALKKVNRALAEVAAYPEALGASNYLGDTVRQRTDPKGIAARALVADIGSLKIHDRSGAVVTASETPRLKPFIPSATDDPATVTKKLAMFKEEYESIQSDIQANYSQEHGFRMPGNKVAPSRVEPAPAAAKPPAKAAPATQPKNAKGWTLHTDAQGNRAYVSPDGKSFEEVK